MVALLLESWCCGDVCWSKEEATGKDVHVLLRTESYVPLEDIKTNYSKRALGWRACAPNREGKRIYVESRWALKRDINGKPLLSWR
jgi:hypothetical protein